MRVSEEPVCSYLFRQNPAFTSLHLRSPVHVVPPLGVLDVEQVAHCTRRAHREEVELAQLSDVMTAGTPNLLTHPPLKQSTREVYSCGGGNRYCFWPARSLKKKVLSTIVNLWVKPFDAGKGPNRSTWMWLKRSKGTTWRWILACLQCSRPCRRWHHWRVPYICSFRQWTDP